MKKSALGFACVALICTVIISITVARSPRHKQTGDSNVAPNEDVIVTQVQEYWSAALEGDTEKAHTYLTKTPMSFIRNCKFVLPGDVDNTPPQSNAGQPTPSTRGLSLNTIDEEWTSVVGFTEAIHKNKYVLQKVKILRLSGEDAFVNASYGNKEEPYLGYGFLLHKEESGWKIFAPMNKSKLAVFCDNFAR